MKVGDPFKKILDEIPVLNHIISAKDLLKDTIGYATSFVHGDEKGRIDHSIDFLKDAVHVESLGTTKLLEAAVDTVLDLSWDGPGKPPTVSDGLHIGAEHLVHSLNDAVGELGKTVIDLGKPPPADCMDAGVDPSVGFDPGTSIDASHGHHDLGAVDGISLDPGVCFDPGASIDPHYEHQDLGPVPADHGIFSDPGIGFDTGASIDPNQGQHDVGTIPFDTPGLGPHR
jgi:hypothetical protein